jgi:acrylyl-CoA reductase (NADPH)
MKESIRAYVLEGSADHVSGRLRDVPSANLPAGDVTVRVTYSSINYKDAMIAAGVGRMVRNFPHVPGVDLAGEVREDRRGTLKPGEKVLVTGYDLGVGWFGGYAEYAKVPGEWVVPLPKGLTDWEAMALGTAGFTAMLALMALERNGLGPERGPVLVTGATGGVGSIAIDLFAGAGYSVAASSGKPDMRPFLEKLGAAQILTREEVNDSSPKVLLKETWAGAVDNAGGDTLSYLLRTTQTGGSVALCGLVQGNQLHATVYPFILRGVNLLGIDSVNCPMEQRLRAWERLAGPNKPRNLREIGRTIGLDDLPRCLKEILSGGARGRYIVQLAG